MQSGDIDKPAVDEEWITVSGGPTGSVRARIVKPAGATGTLPVIIYIHGAGWVFGNAHTHDRLVRELAVGANAAVVFPEYDLEGGESLGELQGRFPLSPLVSNLKEWTYPAPGGGDAVEVTIAEAAFPSVFAADVPAEVTKVLAAAQRPLASAAFEETASAAAWKTKPSWALVAGADEAINPDVERFGAKRAGATVVEVEGASHAVAVSRPKDVADLIRDAVRATS
ncbi:alpha/beta hydrolase [Streptomyces sp. NPDC093984]|uniref:alpha/beta hydrolase n=1 Tax=Streptomyces sp. NPDC093984 TaxID=3366052 RepID=UPI0037FADC0D